MSGIGEGSTHALRSMADPSPLHRRPGVQGRRTYSSTGDTERIQSMYENIFAPLGGYRSTPSARNGTSAGTRATSAFRPGPGTQRLPHRAHRRSDHRCHQLPFTRTILPYVYLEYPDQDKWNVYSFDEGIASRVPRICARPPQTKRSSRRQGLAIAMSTTSGVGEGPRKLQESADSAGWPIQMTNDLDVHIAPQAPSYQKHMNEKYHDVTETRSALAVRRPRNPPENPQRARYSHRGRQNHLKTWGSQPPTFCCATATSPRSSRCSQRRQTTSPTASTASSALRRARSPVLPRIEHHQPQVQHGCRHGAPRSPAPARARRRVLPHSRQQTRGQRHGV